jgi:hypothetical protein
MDLLPPCTCTCTHPSPHSATFRSPPPPSHTYTHTHQPSVHRPQAGRRSETISRHPTAENAAVDASPLILSPAGDMKLCHVQGRGETRRAVRSGPGSHNAMREPLFPPHSHPLLWWLLRTPQPHTSAGSSWKRRAWRAQACGCGCVVVCFGGVSVSRCVGSCSCVCAEGFRYAETGRRIGTACR